MDPESSSGPLRGGRSLEAAVFLIALLATLPGQGDRQLQAPDEMREAGMSRAMARTGDFITPRLNGKPFLEKPPLFHAVQAAVFRVTGSSSRFTARLPAVLFALATMGATWLLARRLGGSRTAALAALVLATTAGFWSASHGAVTDDAVPPFVTMAFYFLLRAREPGASLWPWLGAGLSAGLAFLAKGAPGPAVIAAGALAWFAAERDLRRVLGAGMAVAALGFLLPAAAWLAALGAREGSGAVREVFLQNILRAASSSADHGGNPVWYYLKEMPLFFLPWTPVLLGGFLAGGAALASKREGDPAGWLDRARLPAAWLFAGLLLLSIASAKRRVYLLPLAPAGAILIAQVLALPLFEASPGRAHRAALALVAAAILGLAGASVYDGIVRPEDLAAASAGGTVAALGVFPAWWWLRAGKIHRLTALAFLLVTLAFVVGDRGRAPRENERRGFEEFSREAAEAIGDRPAVLFRPRDDESESEGLRGALNYYFDRDFQEAIGPEGLSAARLAAGGSELAVLAAAAPEELAAVLGPGRVAVKRRMLRGDVVVVIHGAPPPPR